MAWQTEEDEAVDNPPVCQMCGATIYSDYYELCGDCDRIESEIDDE